MRSHLPMKTSIFCRGEPVAQARQSPARHMMRCHCRVPRSDASCPPGASRIHGRSGKPWRCRGKGRELDELGTEVVGRRPVRAWAFVSSIERFCADNEIDCSKAVIRSAHQSRGCKCVRAPERARFPKETRPLLARSGGGT
jgi:hypothetical protein